MHAKTCCHLREGRQLLCLSCTSIESEFLASSDLILLIGMLILPSKPTRGVAGLDPGRNMDMFYERRIKRKGGSIMSVIQVILSLVQYISALSILRRTILH